MTGATLPLAAGDWQAQLAVDCRCELGEGILWDERDQALLWTDIHAARLWRHHPQTGVTRSWRLPDRLGSMALCESGCLLLGLAKGLALADLRGAQDSDTLHVQALAVVDEHPSLRINDGRTDRSGHFVFGTLDEAVPKRPIGRFYQYSAQHGLRALDLGGVAIPNSLAFAPDGRTLFFCDTLRGDIMACDYDAAGATVGAARTFARVASPGGPDGAAIDSDGRLWSAQWGAGCVVAYGRDGTIEHRVALPVSQPSCPAFGGSELNTLYVSTAHEGLSADDRAREAHAGGVFSVCIDGVRGMPEARVADL